MTVGQNRPRPDPVRAALRLFCWVGRGYRAMGIFGAGFIVGGIYCSTLAALGNEAIAMLTGVAL